jgi:hypothetical protein
VGLRRVLPAAGGRGTGAVSEATDVRRRCSGYCGAPIPSDKQNTYTVIEPDGRLRVFCDSDCLRFFYLDAWRAFLRSEGLRADDCLCHPEGEAGRRRPGPAQ